MKVLVKGKEYRVTSRQADTLVKIGRATYLTRDMQAQPVADVDAAGVAWNSEQHAASRIKNLDGTWRKKPGAKAQE
jgi:hypothetical protein